MHNCVARITLMLTAMFAFAAIASANNLYFQGFETNTSGWIVDTGGDNNGSINRTASGGGTLRLTAFDGSYYGEAGNSTNAYQPGYGSGGFDFFGGNDTSPNPYPGSAFSQFITVYINVTTAAPNSPSVPAFWIDMSPDSITSDGVGCFPAACSDEQNFQLYYTGSSVNVGVTGSAPVLTINSSGWYTFQMTYAQGGSPTSLVNTNMNIYNSLGALLSTTPEQGNSDGGTLQSSNLAGPGYVWLPAWQNGFSNNVLGIDDVRADTLPTPEPSGLLLMLTGLLALGVILRRRFAA